MLATVSTLPSDRGSNRFLAALSRRDYEHLRPHLEKVQLVRGDVVYEEGATVRSLYFVQRGIISQVKTMRDGRTVEIGAVGTEGMLGWNAALGMKHAIFDAMVQVPGEALRLDATVFQLAAQASPALRDLTQRFGEHALADIAQTAACNRLHSLEERCCRWLLIAHDSAQSYEFSLTHEFLAMMLGVQRTAVSIAANLLRRAGLIEYARGRITVINRRGLEAMSCECYDSIQDRLSHLYARHD